MSKRDDGRLPDELRRTKIEPGYNRYAEGSALCEVGHTRVLCTVSIEDKVPVWMRDSGRGWVTAEYSMLPRATHNRERREVTKGKPSGRTYEIQRLLGRAFRAAVDLEALGEVALAVDCDVLQADGGTRCAAVNGGMVALVHALRHLVDKGRLESIPLKYLVSAVSVGRVGDADLLDLAYEEDSSADLDLNVIWAEGGPRDRAATARGARLVELQGGAEGEPFAESDLTRLLALARIGAERVFEMQRHALKGVL